LVAGGLIVAAVILALVATGGAPAVESAMELKREAVGRTVEVTISAPGASEIKVNGYTEAHSSELTYEAKIGQELKILAIASEDRKKLVRFTPSEEGESVEIELPEPTARSPAAYPPIVIIQAQPEHAVVTVNGKVLALVKGNAKVPGMTVGEVFTLEATAADYEPFKRQFTVRNLLETFDITLRQAGGAASPASTTGKVTINAKPWAKVSRGGKALGLTPYSKKLPPGEYTFMLTKGSIAKSLRVTIRRGATVRRTVHMN